MLKLRAAARGISGLNAALACLAVLAGCGSVAGAAGTASAVRSPGAVAGPASDAGAASQAGTGSAGSPPADPPAAKANVKHVDFLNGVSCASAANCTAVGDYYRTAAGPQLALIERWNGSSWQVIGSVDVASWNQLSAVSCTSPRACTAVGSSASGQFALAERWAGSTWTTHQVPDANLTGYTKLTAVSCSSASTCMAAGTYNGGIMAVAESWDGATSQLYRMPSPPQLEPYVQPTGLSCTGPAACVAVGTDGRTLAEIWAGAHWQITPTPSP